MPVSVFLVIELKKKKILLNHSVAVNFVLHFMNIFLRGLNSWDRNVPDSVDDLRSKIIKYMEEHRRFWTDRSYDARLQRFVNPPLSESLFLEILDSQRNNYSWTDNYGIFVQAACMYLDIELHIVVTNQEKT